MAHKIANGAIIGITSEDGIAAKKRVALVDRTTMRTVAVTQSDEFGAYTFNGLNPDSDSYLVFAVDDDGEPKKAALVFDYVKPIPAHAGGFFWSNWYYIAMQKEPMAIILGNNNILPEGAYDFPFGVGHSTTLIEKSSITQVPESETLGAANIPSIILSDGFVGRNARNQKDYLQSEAKTSVSCEMVIKPIELTRNTLACLAFMDDSIFNAVPTSNILSGIMMLYYTASTNEISVYRNDGTDPSSSATLKSKSTLVLSYALPLELRNKSIHIAASLTYGGFAAIYINGIDVANTTIVSTVLRPRRTTQYSIVAFVGSELPVGASNNPRNYRNTNLQYSMVSFYSEPMTEVEAMSRYKALFENTLPLVTGYERAVIEDYPTYYFRLGDETSSPIAIDRLRPFAINDKSQFKKIGSNKMSQSTETPLIRGGAGTIFNGGFIVGEYVQPIVMSSSELTIEFVAKPNAIGAYQVIFSHFFTNVSPTIQLEIINTGALKITWLNAGDIEEVYALSHVLDIAALHHYAMTINKITKLLSLYVDGVLVESKTISGALFKTYAPAASNWSDIGIGARRIAGSPMTSNGEYKGYLAELAIYQKSLSAARVAEHYEARLVI